VKHNEQNASVKSSVKTSVRGVLQAADGKDIDAAKAALAEAIPTIAKAAAKGAFHKKTASRKISRLTKRVNSLKA
jgi:small subunit ribosomal protein S20